MLQDEELLFNCSHKAGWTRENSMSIVQLASTQGTLSLTFIWQRNQSQTSEQSSPPTGFQADMGISRMQVKAIQATASPLSWPTTGVWQDRGRTGTYWILSQPHFTRSGEAYQITGGLFVFNNTQQLLLHPRKLHGLLHLRWMLNLTVPRSGAGTTREWATCSASPP